ncbi:MAG TPA: hypothetical protein VGK19_15565 [Capsulimonadaceae bacterium]|jgi:hypothetical protein
MEISEFKRRVRQAFGPNMEHATPANVREFIDGVQREMWRDERSRLSEKTGIPRPPYDLSGPHDPVTYEGALRSFFAAAIDEPDDQAFIALWMFTLDLAYNGIEEMQSDSLSRLFVDDNSP